MVGLNTENMTKNLVACWNHLCLPHLPQGISSSRVHYGLATTSNASKDKHFHVIAVTEYAGSLMQGGKLTHGTDKWLSNSCALYLSRKEGGNRSPDQHMTITELETWEQHVLLSRILQKPVLPTTQRHCFYLSCPSSLLIQLQVLFGQSCIFTLHLLQLDLLSRKSRYYTKALCLIPPDCPAEQLHCSCFLMVQDAGGMLLEDWEANSKQHCSNRTQPWASWWGWTWMTFKVSSSPNQSVISWTKQSRNSREKSRCSATSCKTSLELSRISANKKHKTVGWCYYHSITF